MARLGFYNIMTIECLSRQINTRNHQFTPLTKATVDEAKTANTTSTAPDSGTLDDRMIDGKMIARRRKQKQNNKESKKLTKMVSMPQAESRGHTGYLTFATKF